MNRALDGNYRRQIEATPAADFADGTRIKAKNGGAAFEMENIFLFSA